MKFYKTLEDCLMNASDKMAPVVEEVMRIYDFRDFDYDWPCAYAIMLVWLGGHMTQNAIDKIKKFFYYNDLVYSLPRYTNISELNVTDMQLVNNLLHILHTEYPDVREDARELIHEDELYEGLALAHPTYEGIVLTGGSAVPSEWRDTILSSVNDLDVYADCRVTWIYSHLFDSNYDYSIPEAIEVTITGVSKEEVELARNRVNSLHFVWSGGKEC